MRTFIRVWEYEDIGVWVSSPRLPGSITPMLSAQRLRRIRRLLRGGCLLADQTIVQIAAVGPPAAGDEDDDHEQAHGQNLPARLTLILALVNDVAPHHVGGGLLPLRRVA